MTRTTKFKPGESGNPVGRPPGRDMANITVKTLDSIADTRKRGEALLANLLPYDVWVARCPESVALVERTLGNPRKFYDQYKNSILDMIENGVPKYLVVKDGKVVIAYG